MWNAFSSNCTKHFQEKWTFCYLFYHRTLKSVLARRFGLIFLQKPRRNKDFISGKRNYDLSVKAKRASFCCFWNHQNGKTEIKDQIPWMTINNEIKELKRLKVWINKLEPLPRNFQLFLGIFLLDFGSIRNCEAFRKANKHSLTFEHNWLNHESFFLSIQSMPVVRS